MYLAWGIPRGQMYDGVRIERDTSPAFKQPVVIGEQLPAEGELFDTAVENLQTYYYRFQSYRSDPAQVSDYSDTLSVIPSDTTSPPPVTITSIISLPLSELPSNIKAGVSITWATSTPEVVEYEIYRSTVQGQLGELVASVPSDQLQTNDTTVQPGVTYYFSVLAVDASGNTSALKITVPATVGNSTPFSNGS